MKKGRNSTCITIRLDNSVVQSLQKRAEEQGFATPGEYIKAQILKSCSVITTPRVYHYGNHYEPGEKVLIQRGKRLVEMTVPKLDADGHPVPD